MANILPQAANMNRGAWYRTEKIIECYRDIDELLVLGGVIWGDNPNDDYFLASHGVATPDAFWKLILRGKDRGDRVDHSKQPGSNTSTPGCVPGLGTGIRGPAGDTFPEVPDYAKGEKPAVSWLVPFGYDQG